ncbi:MAG TPA: PAS domain-containing protein [Puia sp.]|jgi:PAS domain S-box-containing protein|nr:PAS domain-containing protein [Puia sp.]
MKQSETISVQQNWNFLHGGGEMGNLIRARDWSTTSVGLPSEWPHSLRTTLSIILNSGFPMFLFWGPELVSFYNDRFRPSLGEEGKGKHPDALGKPGAEVWPEIWEFIKPWIDQVLQKGEAVRMEDQLVPFFRNGRIEDIYWTFSYSPVEDESGNIAGVVVTCVETTEKVITIAALQASDQRFRNLIREANIGIVILRGEEMIVDIVNEAYGRLIDRTPTELLNKPLFDIIPDAEDPFRAILDNVRTSGEPINMEGAPYHVNSNGNRIDGFVDVIYQPYKEADGSITGVIALCADVTERTISRKKIEEAEAKARLAIESASLGTYEIDLASDHMITSERFDAIWGIPHSLTRTQIVDRIHPDDRADRLKAHQESLKKGHIEYEARIIWPDQSQHWVRIKGALVYDDQGKPITLLGVVQDISEQKQFAEQLTRQVNERTIELKRSNDDLLQFAHVISHDLKEPVRKIKVFSNRIKDDLGDALPGKTKSYIDKIQNAAGRMSAMIEGVLTYSSVSSDEEALELVNLNDIVKNIIADLEIPIQQKSAQITSDHLPTIQGVPVLLHQLFYNLLNNSLKFSRPDIPPLIQVTSSSVRATSTSDRTESSEWPGISDQVGNEMVEIVVSDNGIGFEQAYATRIFDSFTRLHSKDAFEGTGLGLALCKKIVERHGGTISATGARNAGARISIKLPLRQEE